MQIPRACRKNIVLFFESITPQQIKQYKADWQTIMPTSEHETLNRWRFAYCTVHTPWLRSCEQYDKIKPLYENADYQALARILRNTSGGMWDIKANGISRLHSYWTDNQEMFDPQPNWQEFRNKLADKMFKLGLAKTSFALEMLHPMTAQIICIDRHMFKAFGWENVDLACSTAQYLFYEDYWLSMSNEYGIPPVISRNLFWDQIQNQTSSLYWANYLN